MQITKPQPDRARAKWVPIIRARGFQPGHLRIVEFGDIGVLVCNVEGTFYAYRNACALGGRPLGDAIFEGPMLTCSCHGYRYDLRREGACIEKPDLHLYALPLMVEDDKVKVAL